MKTVIMAGGQGTRLRSLTADLIPKPMIPLAGQPLLERQIRWLAEAGLKEICLVIGHLGDIIRAHFGSGEKFGVSIRYYQETTPLGSGGALPFLLDYLTDDHFFLVFGDVFFDIDFRRLANFHFDRQAAATVLARPNSHPFDSDLVQLDGQDRVLGFDLKNRPRDYWHDNLANASLFILDRSVACFRPAPEMPEGGLLDFEKDILAPLIAAGHPVYAYRTTEYIQDVGTVERLRQAERALESGTAAARNLARPQRGLFLERNLVIRAATGADPDAAELIRLINNSPFLALAAPPGREPDELAQNPLRLVTLLGKKGIYLDAGSRGEPDGPFINYIRDYHLDLKASWMVSGVTEDLVQARAAGLKTHAVEAQTSDAGRAIRLILATTR